MITFQAIEKSCSKKKIQFFGVDVWPIYRIFVPFWFISKDQQKNCQPSSSIVKEQGANFPRLHSKDTYALFLTTPENLVTIQGKVVDKSINAVLSNERKNRNKICVINTSQYEYKLPGADVIVSFSNKFHENVKLFAMFLLFLTVFVSPSRHVLLIRALSFKGESIKNKFLLFFRMHLRVMYVYVYYAYLKWKLRGVKISALYTDTYYTCISMAYVLYCKKNNIDTINVQHGNQSKAHPAFCEWHSVHASGYNVIPATFYCWDKESSSGILSWNNVFHSPVIVGHPLADVFKTKFSERHFERDHRIVLITLQPRIGLCNDIISSIIQKSVDEPVVWYVRLHPRQDNQYGKAVRLYASISKSVEVFSSSESSIFEQLINVDLHITGFSSAYLEAKYLNVPTIFFDKRALEYYPDYIFRNKYSFSTGNKELYRFICDKLKLNTL